MGVVVWDAMYLISLNPLGAHSGGSSMGRYSHIALCVTCKFT